MYQLLRNYCLIYHVMYSVNIVVHRVHVVPEKSLKSFEFGVNN